MRFSERLTSRGSTPKTVRQRGTCSSRTASILLNLLAKIVLQHNPLRKRDFERHDWHVRFVPKRWGNRLAILWVSENRGAALQADGETRFAYVASSIRRRS